MCRIIASAAPSMAHPGLSVARFHCHEHGMEVSPAAVTSDTMCAIGRIEKARDEALKSIAEAQRIHWVDAVSTKDYKV